MATLGVLSFHGFQGTLEFSNEDNMYRGRVVLDDCVALYKSDTLRGAERCFHEAIFDHLDLQERIYRR